MSQTWSSKTTDKQPAVALKVDGLTVDYGRTRALNNINFSVREGDFLGIIGPNGGGKTTLLKAILGLIKPTEGRVQLFGQEPQKSLTRVGYVPQIANLDRRFPINVEDLVLMGKLPGRLTPFFRFGSRDQDHVHELLDKTGIFSLRKRQVGQLSGGEFQKALIARALASNPSLLVLDEPTASVDTHAHQQIAKLLQELNTKLTIVLVTHDLSIVTSQVKTLACLNGTMFYHGKPELDQSIFEEAYGCPVELLAPEKHHSISKKTKEDATC